MGEIATDWGYAYVCWTGILNGTPGVGLGPISSPLPLNTCQNWEAKLVWCSYMTNLVQGPQMQVAP